MNILEWFYNLYRKCVEGESSTHQTKAVTYLEIERTKMSIMKSLEIENILDKMEKCVNRKAEFIITGRCDDPMQRYEISIYMEPGAFSITEDE